MKKTPSIICFVAAALFACAVSMTAHGADMKLSTGDGQKSVEITVYNQNMGLVKDIREIDLAAGLTEVRFMDVASQIIPTSVGIRPLVKGSGFTLLEQNYEYDLMSPRKLLDKFVGKNVRLVTKNQFTDKEEIITAKVLSNNEGVPVYQIGNEITFNHPGRVYFPELPSNLIAKPTLVWTVTTPAGSRQDVEVLYLTNGITWRADYVLLLDEKDARTDVSGWVTIDNRSGTSYRDAKLKLVAGDVNRVMEEQRPSRVYAKKADAMPAAPPQFREESLFEYHLYALDRKTTIKENQTKQVRLLEAKQVPLKKEFVYRGGTHYLQSRIPGPVSKDRVQVYVEMTNRKENNLGMPLPKGIVRVYKSDSAGSIQFIGEDMIAHTPKDEKVRLKLGDAFDLAVERRQMAWEKIAKDTTETAFDIILRNHKKEDVVVDVLEPFYGDWKILESSHQYKKIDAATVSFPVSVRKDGETKLTYRVRVKY